MERLIVGEAVPAVPVLDKPVPDAAGLGVSAGERSGFGISAFNGSILRGSLFGTAVSLSKTGVRPVAGAVKPSAVRFGLGCCRSRAFCCRSRSLCCLSSQSLCSPGFWLPEAMSPAVPMWFSKGLSICVSFRIDVKKRIWQRASGWNTRFLKTGCSFRDRPVSGGQAVLTGQQTEKLSSLPEEKFHRFQEIPPVWPNPGKKPFRPWESVIHSEKRVSPVPCVSLFLLPPVFLLPHG